MSAADVQAIYHAVVSAAVLVFTTLVGIYVPRAIAAIDRRTGVDASAQEVAQIKDSVLTGAGLIQTQIDQGLLKIADVRPDNPAVQKAAADALARVPAPAMAQAKTLSATAQEIVGAVDTSPAKVAPPVVAVVPSQK